MILFRCLQYDMPGFGMPLHKSVDLIINGLLRSLSLNFSSLVSVPLLPEV